MSEQNKIGLSLAHAYTPNEQASYGGGEHLVVDHAVVLGRIKRDAGDALCKPRHKFWGLGQVDRAYKLCRRCRELAERYDLEVPPLESELDSSKGI